MAGARVYARCNSRSLVPGLCAHATVHAHRASPGAFIDIVLTFSPGKAQHARTQVCVSSPRFRTRTTICARVGGTLVRILFARIATIARKAFALELLEERAIAHCIIEAGPA